MPLVKVYRRAGRRAAENRQILEAVHAALVESFKIPDNDRNHLLFEQTADHFDIPGDRTDAFTLIEVAAFPGRTDDAKRGLYRGIVARLETIGIGAADVFVILNEPPLINWSVRDGRSSSDAKPAFKLDV